jgi:hypothetical protein
MKPAGEEPPEPAPAILPAEPPADEESKNEAFLSQVSLVSDAFERVISKYKRTGHQSTSVSWAMDRLRPPIRVIATMRGIDSDKAQNILRSVVEKYVCEGVKLEDKHAKIFANKILIAIGGNGHGSER